MAFWRRVDRLDYRLPSAPPADIIDDEDDDAADGDDSIWVCSDIGAWEPPRMPALVQKIAYVGKNNNSGKLQP